MPQSATGRPPITPRIRSVATSRAVTRMPLRDGSLLFSVSLVKFGGPPTDRAGWPWRLYSGATRARLRRDRKMERCTATRINGTPAGTFQPETSEAPFDNPYRRRGLRVLIQLFDGPVTQRHHHPPPYRA